ncbi:GntR family transcriptional regulator [Jiella endophytica]|uniref:GntR family transcriptional regulator n=1 Tax=Jiella endophytica TaxID=2558362 RepID=A0A4Y8RUY9_9HYPH|nr:GntR family transcriptional regulator [Jiella endophytica]TFF27341.1 GntR family transcriptional regulator [Jiella endophytica]
MAPTAAPTKTIQTTASRRPRRQASGKSTAAFAALKRDIMLGALQPGDSLVELELAERFGCSQGTIREALLQLQDEGLVLRHGYRGTQVSDCTEDEAVELFRIRQSIECRGIVRAMERPGRALVADLDDMVGAMIEAAEADDELELASIDRDFHQRLFGEARLTALEPILRRCLVHNHRYKISRSAGPRDLVQTARRHEPIVAAIRAGDAEAAKTALFHHIATIVDFGPTVFPGAPE